MSIRTVRSAKGFHGTTEVPGDKSISHRSLIFGALAEGNTEVQGLLDSGDVQSSARCLRALGVGITKVDDRVVVEGRGARGLAAPSELLDCGNSGTTMRILMGVLAGSGITATLTGDASLVRRPMKRVAEPLERMGASFTLSNGDFAPLTVVGARLHGVDYELKTASAQIKTAILMAGLFAEGTTRVTGKIQSRDHTERMLRDFGGELQVGNDSISIQGGQTLHAAKIRVPGDPSGAAFWMAAAALVPGGEVRLTNISLNPTRNGFARALRAMGAEVTLEDTGLASDPIGTITVRAGALRGIHLRSAEIPTLIDELPVLAVVASQATGRTLVEGAEELRVKETDRIEAIAVNLRAMGCEIEVRKDGFVIEGPQKLKGADLRSFDDHRIAMAFSVAGLVADGETRIHDPECVNISYPEFFETLGRLVRS